MNCKYNLKKENFLVVLFIILSFISLNAQDNSAGQYKIAEDMYKAELYYDAITEYKRLLFFDSTKYYEYEGNCKIALCYKMGGKYNEAVHYFIKAEKSAPGANEKFEAQIQIIRVNILRRTTGRAIELLDILEANLANKSKIEEIHYWKGWAYMLGDDLEKAAGQFGQIDQNHELKKLCGRANSDKYSVTFAKVISYILPGAGEIYTGEIVSGLLSLGWNALFGYMTVNSFVEKRVFDGILTGDLLFLRFYRGTIQNAEKFALSKNLEITNKMLLYIQNNYRGIKP